MLRQDKSIPNPVTPGGRREVEGTAHAVSLERAGFAENWLGNIPNFVTSSSCPKGKSVILGPASSTSRLQPGQRSSTALWPRSKENVCHFPEG